MGENKEGDFSELFKRLENPGDVFMDTLKRDKMVVAPGVYCAKGSQQAAEIKSNLESNGKQCAFNAVYGSGWAISAMLWGKPDYGFHDLTTMKIICAPLVAAAYQLPVILDAETGFGNYVTLPQTVEAYHEMRVAVAHLEDQATVRRCGNLGGKECVDPQEMVAKIRSWLMTSKELRTSMRLMARTDALTALNGGLDDAIERGKRYMDTDYQGLRPTILWADAMMEPKVIEKWVSAMRKHDPDMILGINYSPNKDWTGYYKREHGRDPPTYEELYDNGRGFSVIWHTILQARANFESTYDVFADMAQNGASALWKLHERQKKHPVGDSQKVSNVLPWQALEMHLGGQEAKSRFDNSKGYKDDEASKNIFKEQK